MDELNHKIQIKENQLGISKERELLEQIKLNEKEIGKLKEKVTEKDKIINQLKVTISNLQKEQKVIVHDNDNTNNEEINQLKEEIENLRKEHKDEMTKVINEKDLIFKEKLGLENKISKMKSGIMEITERFEKELSLKEKKVKLINETNAKAFNDLQNKNSKLSNENINLNNIIRSLKREKYDLETIVLKQEDTIKFLNSNQKLNISTLKKELFDKKNYSEKILPINTNITSYKKQNNSIDSSFSKFNDLSLPYINS